MFSQNFTATIRAGGMNYTAWESIMVRRDWENGISVFEFTPSESAYGPKMSGLQLKPGDPVQVFLGNQQVINGAITTRSVAYDKDSHQVVIAGKSKTDDLRKSSVVVKPGNYDGSTFEQAARAVMAPHGIGLVMKNPPSVASKPFQSLSVQYGETVAEFINRLVSMRQMFVTDDPQGNLVVGQGANAAPVAELVEGQNILRASWTFDNAVAWRKMAATAQQPGGDQNWPPRAISASVTNGEYPANWYRLFIAEHPGDGEDVAAQLNYNQMRMLLGVLKASVTVAGWFKPDGTLWMPTDNVSVYAPMAFPDATAPVRLGVQSTTFSQDAQSGTTTTLDLRWYNALSRIPYVGTPDIGSPTPTLADAQPDAPDYSVAT